MEVASSCVKSRGAWGGCPAHRALRSARGSARLSSRLWKRSARRLRRGLRFCSRALSCVGISYAVCPPLF